MHDERSLVEGQDESRKRRKRYIRSKNGCMTCRTRKVKCDERRPECVRCETEERECSYLEDQAAASPGRPVVGVKTSQQQSNAWYQTNESIIVPGTSRLAPTSSTSATPSVDHTANLQDGRVGPTEPTQYDDWLAYLFGSSAHNDSHSDLETSITEWMSNHSILMPERYSSQEGPSNTLQRQNVLPFHTTSEVGDALSSEQRRKLADSTLQRRLRELCSSEVQLEAVSQCKWASLILRRIPNSMSPSYIQSSILSHNAFIFCQLR